MTKQSLGWAGAAALVACAVCCALPLSAVLGSGLVGSLAAYLSPGAEWVAGLGAAVITLGFFAARARMRVRTRATRCATDRSCCGGGSARCSVAQFSAAPNAAIACTLSETDMVQRVTDFRAAFSELLEAERFEGGCRWRFRDREGLAETLRALAAREHECCSFVAFDIFTEGDQVVWETRGPAEAQGAIDVFFELPTSLQERDVHTIAREAEQAGVRLVGEGM